jgi:hypothetical protein
MPLKDLPADKPLSMLALARLRCQRTAYYWEKTNEWLANNRRDLPWLALSIESSRRPGSRWKETWQDREAESTAWIREKKRHDQVMRRSKVLHAALVATVREVLASPNYISQGVCPDCTTAEVPRGIADQLQIDIANSILRTSRGMTWEEVNVRRRLLVKPTQEEVDAWFATRVKNWPEDKPPPDRKDDQKDAEHHFDCKGLRDETRSARKRLAGHWASGGPKGRKKAKQAEARAKLFKSAAALNKART